MLAMLRFSAVVVALGLMAYSPAQAAADPVRGKQLYWNTNGASKSCGSSSCHNGFPTARLNKINLGTNPSTILSAISSNKGGMGVLSGFVNSTDAADIAAYIANPAAGDAAAPAISLSASTLSFGSQMVGTSSAAQTITVSNTGTAALTFSAMTFSGAASADFARTGTCSPTGSVAAGGSCTLLVTFTPSAAGTRAATLTLSHNATGSTSAITLSGSATAAAAAASVSPTSLSFTQAVGATSAAQTVTVSNTGGAALALSSISFGGAHAAEFTTVSGTTCTAGGTVSAGSSCVLRVAFTPGATGARSATLAIAHSASGSATSVVLSGTGTATAVPAATLSASSLTFTEQNLGTSSAAQTVTLTNTGAATLTLSSLTLSGAASADFARAGTCAAGGSVAAGSSCTVRMTFTPSAVGSRTAVLTVASNASNGSVTLSLSGAAVQRVISVSPAAVTLSAQVGQISAASPEVIANAGASTLSVSAVSTSAPFTLGTGANACATPPFSLASGQSCNVYVAFQPTVSGTVSAELAVTSNAAASPARVTLTGQGQASATEASVNEGLGGCSIGPANQLFDPVLLLMLAVSVAVLIRRRRRSQHK